MCSITGDQTSARTALRRPRSLLLTSTALASGIVAGATINPGTAEASCAVFAAGLVFCATTTTTNTIFPAGMPNDRSYIFNVPTSASVISGATVDGFGLRFETTAPGGAITVTNEGTVAATNANSFNGLEIQGNGGLVAYQGNGSASAVGVAPEALFAGLAMFNRNGGDIQMGSATSPITGATFTGQRGVVLGIIAGSGDVVGNVSAFLSGGTLTATAATGEGIFLDAPSGSGNVTIVTTGGTVISGGPDGAGIAVRSFGGSASLTTDALVGTAGNRTDTGLFAQVNSGSGAVTVNQTGGSIFASFAGINAQHNGSGNITVTTAGNVNSTLIGLHAMMAAGGGTITVNQAAGSLVGSEFGIDVRNDATANVTVTTAGNVSSTGFLDPDDLIIVGTGLRATSNGSVAVTQTAGSISGVSFGIDARTFGSGSVTVAVAGDVSASTGTGINTNALDGATSITNSGSVTGSTAGIRTQSTGAGSITVTNSGSASGTNTFGIRTDAVNGATKITNSGSAAGFLAGISAVSTGVGTVMIGNTGIVAGSSAIFAQTASGAINITNSGTLTGPGGESAVITAASSTGSIAITNDAAGGIQSLTNSPSGLAIETSGVAATIINAGTLTGRLSLGGSNNVVSNSGTWSTSGASTVGGVFNNQAGGTFATSGSTTLDGLSGVTNAGTFTTAGVTALSGAFGVTNSGTFSANGSTSFAGLTSSRTAAHSLPTARPTSAAAISTTPGSSIWRTDRPPTMSQSTISRVETSRRPAPWGSRTSRSATRQAERSLPMGPPR